MKKQLGPIWNQQWPPQSWLLLTVVIMSSCISICSTAPVHETTDLEQYPGTCYYNYNHYNEGDRILTNEPCLNCTCHNQMLMCYLRVCPFTKPIGHDCVVEKREDQCCPIITCPDVPVELVDHKSDSKNEVGFAEKYGCYIEEKFYPEGAQVPSNPNKPCELCYCIRNRTSCLMQECTLHVDGCQPIYNRGVCCPVRYDCEHDSMIGGPYLEDSHTTVRPTEGFILTTLPSTKESSSCVYNDVTFADGALIPDTKPCEHCYCMKGDIVCAVQECAVHIEHTDGKNCTYLPPPAGTCCPESYICQDDEVIHKIEEDVHDLVSPHVDEAIMTTAQPVAAEGGEVDSATELGEDLHHKLHETVSEEDVQLQEHIDDVLKTTAEPVDAESGLDAIETTTAGLGANIKFAQDSETEGQEATTQLPELSELPSESEGELPEISESVTKAPSDSSLSPLDLATEIPDKSEQGFEQEATPSTDGLEAPALAPHEIVPMAIPGEGDCLYNKVTYRNNSDVPSVTKCDEYCMCISSIIKCRKVQCAIALGPNCRLAENQDPEACCPKYYCDGEETKGEESLATTLPSSSVEQEEHTTVAAVNVVGDKETEGHEIIPQEPEQPAEELSEPSPTIISEPEIIKPDMEELDVKKEHDLSSGEGPEEVHISGESATESGDIAAGTTPDYVSHYDHTEAIPEGETQVSSELPTDQIPEDHKQGGIEEEQSISQEKLPSESFEAGQPTEAPQESTEQSAGPLPGGIEHEAEPESLTERGPSSSEQEPHVDHSEPITEEPEIQATASPVQPEDLDVQQPATGGLEPAHKVDKLPEEQIPEEQAAEEHVPEENLLAEHAPEQEAATTEKNVEEEVEGEQLAQDVTEHSSEVDRKRIHPVPEIIETTAIPAIESMSHVTDAAPTEIEKTPAEHVTQEEPAVEENTTVLPRIDTVPQGESDVELAKPIEENEINKEEQPQPGLPEEPVAVLPSSEPEIDNELTTDELMSAVLDILKGTDAPIIIEPEAPAQSESTEKIPEHQEEDHTEVPAERLPENALEEHIPQEHLPEGQTEQPHDEQTKLPIGAPAEPSQQSPDATELPVHPQFHEKPAEENIIAHGIEEDQLPHESPEPLPEQGQDQLPAQGAEQLPEGEREEILPVQPEQATEEIPKQGEQPTPAEEQAVELPAAPELSPEEEVAAGLPEGTLAPSADLASSPTTETSAEKHETEQEQPANVESQPQVPEDISIHHPSDDKESIFNTIVDNLEEKTTLPPAVSVDENAEPEEAQEPIAPIEPTIPSETVDHVPEELEKPHEPPTKHTELVGTIVPESESKPIDALPPVQPSETLLPEQPQQPSEELLPAEPEQPSEELVPAQPEKPSEEKLPEQPQQPSEELLPEQPQQPSKEKLPEQTQKPVEELSPAQPQPSDAISEVEEASSTSQPEQEHKQEESTTASLSPQEHEEGEQKVDIATESVSEDNVPSLSSTIPPYGGSEIITEASVTPSKDESHLGDENLPTEQTLPDEHAQDGEAEAPIQVLPEDHIEDHIIPTELTEKPLVIPEAVLPEEQAPENIDQGELPEEEQQHVTEENISQVPAIDEHAASPEEPISVDRVSEADNAPQIPGSEEAIEQGTPAPEEQPAAQTIAPGYVAEEHKPALEEQVPQQGLGSEVQTPEPALGLEEQTPEQTSGPQEQATEQSPSLEEHTVGLETHQPAGEEHTLAPEYHAPEETGTESIAPEEPIAVDREPSPTQESSTLSSIEEKLPEISVPVESVPEEEHKPEVEHKPEAEHVTEADIDSTALPERQTQKPEIPAAQTEVPNSEGLEPESVTVSIDERIRPETTIGSIEAVTSSPSDKLHGELPASTTSLPVAEEAGTPESDASESGQRPDGVEIISADLTTQQPLEEKVSTQGAITEANLDVTQEPSEAPKPEQELPERTTQGHTDSVSPSTSKPEEEQRPESSPAVEEATPKIISADENVYTTEAYDNLNKTEIHAVDEAAPESPHEPQSTSPSPTRPAHLPPHSSHDHETQPAAGQFGPSGTGSDSQGEGDFGPMPGGGHYSSFGDEDYAEEEDPSAFGPGTCRYGGKLFVSAQQIPRDDPCDFCFCFRSDIICLQQSCPPPISGCHEEPISGFCCPRYECPVLMGGVLNLTTTTTTTTTVPPHFQHRPSEIIKRAGCYIGGHSYKVGEAIESASGPCIQCSCGGDGQMKCEPKVCSPEPMLRHMIAVAASRRR